ncbi:MAG: dimethylsulfonioproprionate lyase family protein, partial [Pseudomonadota bacterium]
LIPHSRIIVAFLIIGPGRHYPRHHHEAEEIYFPFGGDTLWSQDDEEPHTRAAGEPIHNTPWLPHEMITRETPLFTFCFWISPDEIKLAQLTE